MPDCAHRVIGNLEYNDTELAEAISAGHEFWGVGECSQCHALVDFRLVRGDVKAIVLDETEV